MCVGLLNTALLLGLWHFGATAPGLQSPRPDDAARVDTQAVLQRRIKAEPSSLNPILMFTGVDAEFEYLLWDRPFVLDHRMRWQLNRAVAESYVESADHTSATLTLRAGLRWHDGVAMTAEDVAYSWRQITDERTICRRAGSGPDRLGDCVALDPRIVRFEFGAPMPTNRWNVDFPIIPRHVYEPIAASDPTLVGSDAAVEANRRPTGNGPYRFVEWVGGQRIVLERWDDYPGEQPAYRRIVFRVIPNNSAALLALETGQVDEMDLTPQQFARETAGERFASVAVKARSPGWTSYYIGWNTDGSVPFLADRAVRQALSHAVNTPAIVDRVFFGVFAPSAGLYHPDSWVGPSGIVPYRHDLDEAARLLDGAGWRRDDEDGWRYKSIPSADGARRIRAAFTLNLVQGSQTSPKIADILQQDLRRIGVDMSTRVLEWAVFNERNYKREFAAYLSAWSPGPEPDDAWNLFHSSAREGGRNYTGYASDEVDALFERGRRLFDEEARRDCYRNIAQAIHRDAPYTFLVDAPVLWAFDRRVHGVTFSPRGPSLFFPGVRAWWRAADGGRE